MVGATTCSPYQESLRWIKLDFTLIGQLELSISGQRSNPRSSRSLYSHLVVDESTISHHPTTKWRLREPSLAVSNSFHSTTKAVYARTQPQQHTDCDHKEIHLDKHRSYLPRQDHFTLHASTVKMTHLHHPTLKMQKAHHNRSHPPQNKHNRNSPYLLPPIEAPSVFLP